MKWHVQKVHMSEVYSSSHNNFRELLSRSLALGGCERLTFFNGNFCTSLTAMGMSLLAEGFQWVNADFLPKKGNIRCHAHRSFVRAEGWRGGPCCLCPFRMAWRNSWPGHLSCMAIPLLCHFSESTSQSELKREETWDGVEEEKQALRGGLGVN